MFSFLLLGFANIKNHRTGCADAGLQVFTAKSFKGYGFKLIGKSFITPFKFKRPIL